MEAAGRHRGFEQSELMEPRRLPKEAGFLVDVVSPKDGEIRGWNKTATNRPHSFGAYSHLHALLPSSLTSWVQ